MSDYTPGPWTCHSGSVFVDGPDVWPKGENNGTPIAHMDRETGNGTVPTERNANARLVAAAPELLEACEQAIGMLWIEARSHREHQDHGKAEAVEGFIGAIEETIAKAKGQ